MAPGRSRGQMSPFPYLFQRSWVDSTLYSQYTRRLYPQEYEKYYIISTLVKHFSEKLLENHKKYGIKHAPVPHYIQGKT